jgi:hypothetical protein
MSFPLVDMVGRRIGRLLVLERAGLDSRRVATWKCQCDCGAEAIVAGRELRRRRPVRSCGCLAAESRRRNGQAAAARRAAP